MPVRVMCFSIKFPFVLAKMKMKLILFSLFILQIYLPSRKQFPNEEEDLPCVSPAAIPAVVLKVHELMNSFIALMCKCIGIDGVFVNAVLFAVEEQVLYFI